MSTSFTARPLSSFYADLVKGFIKEGETILSEAQVQRKRIPAYAHRRSPAGDAMRWAMNLVDIDLACTERLLQEIKDARALGVVEKLIAEMRKGQIRMPRDVDNALSALKILKAESGYEAPTFVPEPKPETKAAKKPEAKKPEVKKPEVKPSKPARKPTKLAIVPAPLPQVCALPGCNLTPRENSVYCTDRHRVDMARLNAKLRANALKTRAAK